MLRAVSAAFLVAILVHAGSCIGGTAIRVAVSRPAMGGGLRGPLRRQLACSCQDRVCGCCAQINLQQFGFNQPVCLNFTYNPEDLSITLNVLLNDKSIYETSISGRNPPPLCIPIPQLPMVSICVRLYDIQQQGQDIRACINLEAQVQQTPVLVFAFDCVRVGPSGISVSPKPSAELEPYDPVENT